MSCSSASWTTIATTNKLSNNLIMGISKHHLFKWTLDKLWNENEKWKCVNFNCYSSEELITLNTLHEVVPTWYSFHSWVDWSNADKVSCSRRKHIDAGIEPATFESKVDILTPTPMVHISCQATILYSCITMYFIPWHLGKYIFHKCLFSKKKNYSHYKKCKIWWSRILNYFTV